MYYDYTGLPLTATSAAAVAAYNEAIGAYLCFGRDTGAHLKYALQTEPDMVMANCLMGYFLNLMGARALLGRAEKMWQKAQAQLESANAREQAHLAALKTWTAGDIAKATRIWESILIDHPRDILALKLSQFTHFYLGDQSNLRDSTARVLPAWGEDTPGYSFVLGMRAFGLEESGDYAAAEKIGHTAVELNPNDAWGVHAVAHVMEMQDRHAQGIDWITQHEPHWSQANNFRYHLVWHRALMLLDQGKHDEVLASYDQQLWDPESDEYLDICNDASLLLRLELAGIDVGQRWEMLTDKVTKRINDHIFTFIDAHFTMVLAAAGNDKAALMLDSLHQIGERDSSDTTAALTESVGLTLCQALVAHRSRDYDRAVELLYPIRYRINAIGGSHAQRDVFQQVLIDASLKAGRWPLARALLAERTALKPANAASWQWYAQALEHTADASTAQRARARAQELLN